MSNLIQWDTIELMDRLAKRSLANPAKGPLGDEDWTYIEAITPQRLVALIDRLRAAEDRDLEAADLGARVVDLRDALREAIEMIKTIHPFGFEGADEATVEIRAVLARAGA